MNESLFPVRSLRRVLEELSEFQSHRELGTCDSAVPGVCRHCEDEEADLRHDAFRWLHVVREVLARGLEAEQAQREHGAPVQGDSPLGIWFALEVLPTLDQLGSGATPAQGASGTTRAANDRAAGSTRKPRINLMGRVSRRKS